MLYSNLIYHATQAQAAQDVVVIPAVPSGVSPILGWVMTVAGSMITIFIPIVALWLRNYLAVQTVQARSAMINGSISRAAQLADMDMTRQHLSLSEAGPTSAVMDKALSYVNNSHPDAIAATPQATDEHIVQAITAELGKIANAKADTAPPSVVLSPVSALR